MNLLLLVQNQAQVEKLNEAAGAIRRGGFTGVWAVHSPAVATKESESAKQFDKEIAELEKAESDAAGRRDYDAAKGYRASRDGKVLERAKFIRDAWKSIDADDRKATYQSIFLPFMDAVNEGLDKKIPIKVQTHADHYDPEQWVQMLNSLSGVWFKPFVPGSFMIGWPGAIPTAAIAAPVEAVVTPEPAKPITAPVVVAVPKKPAPAKVFLSREEQLKSLRYFGLAAEAKKAGVDVKGKKGPQIIAEILAAENQPVAV